MKILKYKSFDGKKLNITMCNPDKWSANDRRGLVIFFFGGWWNDGTVMQFEPQAKELSRLGIIVALPEYRVLSRDKTSVDVAVKDAIYCISVLFEHAEEYGIDRTKIILAGGSAGGHLAISSVLLKHFMNPVLDASRIENRAAALQLSPYTSEELSPINYICYDMPDTIIFHGTKDDTVPCEISRQYRDKARALGNKCELIEYPNCNHGFFNFRCNQIKEYYNVLGYMVQFLYEQGLIEFM